MFKYSETLFMPAKEVDSLIVRSKAGNCSRFKYMKKILLLAATLLTHISFASDARVIDGKDCLTFYYYYVETVSPQGALIAEGSKKRPQIEYFVYGLTNVYSDRNYQGDDKFTGCITNDYTDSINKYPALVLVPKEIVVRADADIAKAKQNAAIALLDGRTAMKEAKRKSLDEKTFAYLQNQATNGSPSCQFELGLKYLKGQYPAETNKELGLFWIKAAATNDSPEAKDYIANIKQ